MTDNGTTVNIAGSGDATYFNVNGYASIEVLATAVAGYGILNVTDTAASTTVKLNSRGNSYINGGNFGVGLTVPTAKLHVLDNIALVADGASQDSVSYYPFGVTRAASASNIAYIGMTRAGNIAFGIGMSTGNALIMGATTSTTQVITAAFSLTQTGTLTVSGDVVAYGSPSDISLKIIKEKIPNALDSVLKLNGYKFDWKEPNEIANIKEDIGVIAQEVEELFPELVRKNEDTGFKSVRYQGLIGVLIEAMKEQQKQIDELKALIKL